MHSTNGTGAEYRTHPGSLADLPVVVASEFADWEPPWYRAVFRGEDHPAPTATGLSQAEKRYLEIVVSNPGKGSSFYPKLARISARKALQIRKRLLDLGYIKERQVSVRNRGRPSTLLEPTPRAREELEATGEAKEGGKI